MNEDKVKEIARSMITASHYNNLDDKTFDSYIKEICRLFEPKPDEGRLLTDGEVGEIVGDCKEWWEIPDRIAKAQDAKTASYLVELDPDQSLPDSIANAYGGRIPNDSWRVYHEAIDDMLKAGWVKRLKV